MSEPQPPADAALTLNAVAHALAHQREEVLDTEILFSELIDAVIGVTTGTPVDDPETREWASRFVSENESQLQRFGAALHGDDRQLEHQLAHEFALPPVPPRIEHLAHLRATYDAAVSEGLKALGLEVTEIDYLKGHLFVNTWTGRDGGRVDLHEYDGLPVRVVNLDFDDRLVPTPMVRQIQAVGDPIRDAEAVVEAVRALWSAG